MELAASLSGRVEGPEGIDDPEAAVLVGKEAEMAVNAVSNLDGELEEEIVSEVPNTLGKAAEVDLEVVVDGVGEALRLGADSSGCDCAETTPTKEAVEGTATIGSLPGDKDDACLNESILGRF